MTKFPLHNRIQQAAVYMANRKNKSSQQLSSRTLKVYILEVEITVYAIYHKQVNRIVSSLERLVIGVCSRTPCGAARYPISAFIIIDISP